jgi:hypothetical protein
MGNLPRTRRLYRSYRLVITYLGPKTPPPLLPEPFSLARIFFLHEILGCIGPERVIIHQASEDFLVVLHALAQKEAEFAKRAAAILVQKASIDKTKRLSTSKFRRNSSPSGQG